MFASTAVDIVIGTRSLKGKRVSASYNNDLRLNVWLRRRSQCVFNCWTIPEYIELISNASDGYVRAVSDVCDGGQFSITSDEENREYMFVEGTYLVLDAPYYLKCSWNFHCGVNVWRSTLRLHLAEMENGTQLRLIQTGGNPEPWVVESQKIWWKQRFALMQKLLA